MEEGRAGIRKLPEMEWLTLTKAARRLTDRFGEEVNEEDVLRYALDGKLTLSVIISCMARPCIYTCDGYTEIPLESVPVSSTDKIKIATKSIRCSISKGKKFRSEGSVILLDGLYDLLMIEGVKFEIDHRSRPLPCRQNRLFFGLPGIYVEREDGQLFELQYFSDQVFDELGCFIIPERSPDNYYPVMRLPEDSEIVVRPRALQKLENGPDAECQEQEKRIDGKEKILIPSDDRYKKIFPELKGYSKRKENNDLRIIGAMSQLLTGKYPDQNLPYYLDKTLINTILGMPKDDTGKAIEVYGLKESTMRRRFRKVKNIKRTSPMIEVTDLYIMGSLLELITKNSQNHDLPFENDASMITAMAELLKNIDEIDKEMITIRIGEANREFLSASKD